VTESQTTIVGSLPNMQALTDANAQRSSAIRGRSCPGIV